MSHPSDAFHPSAIEKATTASATTLTLPRFGEADRDRNPCEAAGNSAQDTQVHLSAEKELACEDEEWLENPAHPRNWPPKKKWVNMAIVSKSPPRPSPQQLTAVILGFVLHLCASSYEFNDGAGPTPDRRTLSRNKLNDHSNVTQYLVTRLGLCSPHRRSPE